MGNRPQTKMGGQNGGAIGRFALGAAGDMDNAGDPTPGQHRVHPGATPRIE